MIRQLLTILTVIFLAAISMESAVAQDNQNDHPYFHKSEKNTLAEWSYSGDTGPANWGRLSADYKMASEGRRQSPIDLVDMTDRDLPKIQFSYKPAQIRLVYNGHTIEEVEEDGSSIELDGRRFDLKQFHFHAPSEHTIHGRHFDMEMHLVHKSSEGKICVLGVFIREGDENPTFGQLWKYLPTDENRTRTFDDTINAEDLLPANRSYYTYDGSLTTPPCTEEVKWLILKRPISLSKKQIEAFTKTIQGNNRPVQPLNGRLIKSAR